MVDIESDNASVESGSCTCSDFNPDCSWFYDSRKLGTSFMRFCILSDNENVIIKNEKSKRSLFDDKKLNKNNQFNEIKKDLYINPTNKRKNVIKLTNSSSAKKSDILLDDNINKKKLADNNLFKYSNARKNKNESLDHIVKKNNNRSFKQKSNLSNKYNKSTINDINPKVTNFFPENVNEYEHNYSAPIETFNFQDKNLNLHRSPFSYFNKKKNLFNNIYNKTEMKDKFDFNSSNNYMSPRRNFYNSFTNSNVLNDDNNDEKISKINKNANIINKNYQTRGRTIKEKIVKETKNITIEPGQTIKPKMITKRKLKPHTTIVKNDDGSQNIIIENTVLTTVTVNEKIENSNLNQDKYPLDVQLVRQYITKIYKTEIENTPYRPKKEF
jgi:hypothetical protein